MWLHRKSPETREVSSLSRWWRHTCSRQLACPSLYFQRNKGSWWLKMGVQCFWKHYSLWTAQPQWLEAGDALSHLASLQPLFPKMLWVPLDFLEQWWSLAGMSFIRKSKPLKHPVMSWHLQEGWLDKKLWVDLNLGKRKYKTLASISATLVRNLYPICQMKRKVLRTAYSEVSARARGKQQLQLSKREAFGLASDPFL